MSKDGAVEALHASSKTFGRADMSDQAAIIGAEWTLGVAQVEATLYVGEQLERLHDLIRAGFKIGAAGDTFGDLTRWVEPIGDES